jgi:pyruvate dehydrogenase E1 component beta subunit
VTSASPERPPDGKTVPLNMVQALNQGLRQAMASDPAVVLLGEDIGRNGGVFRVTEGLQKEFGPDRVLDTPLAELGITGMAIGMALNGLKPVAEIQFDGFLPSTLDQVICHLGRLRHRTSGKRSVPLVLRSPHGGMVHAPEHHSESPEAYFCHTPGIKVVIPATPADAKGLIVAAIRDPDPVIFFEPKLLYRGIREEVPEDLYETPIGKARIARPGKDCTVIAWGAMVQTALKAADFLKNEGTEVEVLDLRTLSPIDIDTILKSVSRTGRAVVAHEAPRTCGLGAEVSALIHERALLKLQAPVVRVTGWDTRLPLFRLEKYYYPDAGRIVRAVEQALKF